MKVMIDENGKVSILGHRVVSIESGLYKNKSIKKCKMKFYAKFANNTRVEITEMQYTTLRKGV